jgi:antitoxin component YwqK of YwqJK toxin-antitoxin module
MNTLRLFAATLILLTAACSRPREIDFNKLGFDGMNTFLDPETKKGFTGVARESYPDGKQKAVYNFKNGLYHGTVTEWYQNGAKSSETNFLKGEHCGKNTEWNKDGTLYQIRIYDHERIVSEEKFNGPK